MVVLVVSGAGVGCRVGGRAVGVGRDDVGEHLVAAHLVADGDVERDDAVVRAR